MIMELKNRTYLEVKIDNRIYALECDSSSSLGAVHDALAQMKAYIVERINTQSDNEKKAEEPCQEKSV
jgi:hypothetical protein